jgi:TonB-dependent receptor
MPLRYGLAGLLTLVAVMAGFVGPVLAQGAQGAGSIRGVVYDNDFAGALGGAEVAIVETGQRVETSERGNYVLTQVPPGAYTLVFQKAGFVRQVRSDVVVTPGGLTEVDVYLSGDFADREEFVVEDFLGGGAGTEAALLELRFESPALLDSISSELLSRAGASDAASALNLVSGATVQDGRFAVIRGLPNRFVSSQLNGIRLPTTVDDQRAVELDQFPSTVIESIQVSKTFTPDQQGDATGGAVDVRLKSIPDDPIRSLSFSSGFNSNVRFREDFLGYEGSSLGVFGVGEGNDPQPSGTAWDGAVGVREEDAPIDFKLSGAWGGKRALDRDWTFGGLLTFFYERDSSYYDDGIDDRWNRPTPSSDFQPEGSQGDTPQPPGQNEGLSFITSLFDVTEASRQVQWGGLASIGVEDDLNSIGLALLYSRTTETVARLATDTRGKEYYWPGYDVNDPNDPGNEFPDGLDAAPYLRSEALEYTERDVTSLQFTGSHTLGTDDRGTLGDATLKAPEIEWIAALSRATLDQPDQRQFAALWKPFLPGAIPPPLNAFAPGVWSPLAGAANVNLGNVNRIFRETEEESVQSAVDLSIPFERSGGLAGAFRTGLFFDRLERQFDQDTYSNGTTEGISYPAAGFDDPWSSLWPTLSGEGYDMEESLIDVDYAGRIDISALYMMLELPISRPLELVTGFRLERTSIGIVNDPENQVLYFPPGTTTLTQLSPGVADVDYSQDNVLPSIGLDYTLSDRWTVRGAFSQTLARQTFQELSPIFQQEFLGGPIFVGNPDLRQSEVTNYDLRLDYEPYAGGLFSVSGFYKDITDPIEYVQRTANVGFSFTTPVNYPQGELYGVELEVRQDLGETFSSLGGFKVGGNATILNGGVDLPEEEIQTAIAQGVARESRDLTQAPDYLLNFFLTYDLERTGTRAGLFFTQKGDTLVAGANTQFTFIPDVYQEEYGTLNFTLSQEIAEGVQLRLSAKNLTNPIIREVYRDPIIGDDVTRRARTRGIDFSIGLSLRF